MLHRVATLNRGKRKFEVPKEATFFQSKVTCTVMPPKKGRRRRKVEDEEEEVIPARRGSAKKDEDYVWDEDQSEAEVEPAKKGRKKKSVVWNDNDCRADVCLRPPGTSRYL